MHFVVCIKQVPDLEQVSINFETKALNRDASENIINPFDLYALQMALSLKKKRDIVTVISMGPMLAKKALREALAWGADRAVLLCDREFAASDTWATSYILAQAIKKIRNVDIVFCGKQAIDGDTAHIGPSLSARLNIPLVPFVTETVFLDKRLSIKSRNEKNIFFLKSPIPCVLTVDKSSISSRFLNLQDRLNAYKKKIDIWDKSSLTLTEEVGVKGSLTEVKKIHTFANTRKLSVVNNISISRVLNDLKPSKNIDKLAKKYPVKKDEYIFVIADENLKASQELVNIAYMLAEKLSVKTAAVVIDKKLKNKLAVHDLFFIENKNYHPFDIGNTTKMLLEFFHNKKPLIILGAATSWGRAVLPRLAILLKAGLTADCTNFQIDEKTKRLLQIRPALGGNIFATITTKSPVQMASWRPHSMTALRSPLSAKIHVIKKNYDNEINIVKSLSIKKIRDRDIIIAIGRGVDFQDFKLFKQLAKKLKASIGVSRPLVEEGLFDQKYQIGQSGKIVSPKLYIAFGISGSVQHVVGIEKAEKVICVNKDKNAPIFNCSNMGIIDDYKNVLNKLLR